PADVAALAADPGEQPDRVDPHLRQVAGPADHLGHLGRGVVEGVGDLRDAAEQLRARGGGHRDSWIGASGLTSTGVMWVPRGAATMVWTAAAIAEARSVRGCRAWPHLTHSLITSSVSATDQSLPASLCVGPGRTTDARTPVPSSSMRSASASPSSPRLVAAYPDMKGRARTATSEERKTMSPRRRSTMRGRKARTNRCGPSRLTCSWRRKS